MSESVIGRYRAADGTAHEVLMRQLAGGWQVLDLNGAAIAVVEALSDEHDGRPQAEAIARDYLTTVNRLPLAAGRTPVEPISEKRGSDAPSNPRPSPEARPRQACRAALPGAAG